ncbi:MAG TPA: ATP-binding protein [Bacillota bacterium]|nr:ATP-binding protein [Bacillota bacterium]
MVTWYIYMFQFLPESLVMNLIAFILTGGHFCKKNINKLLIAAILYSTLVYAVWDLQLPASFRILLNIQLFLISTWIGHRSSIVYALSYTLIAVFSLWVFEYIGMFLITHIFLLDLAQILDHPFIRLLIGFAVYIPMSIAAYLFYRYNIHLNYEWFSNIMLHRVYILLLFLGQLLLLSLYLYMETFKINQNDFFGPYHFPVFLCIILLLNIVLFAILLRIVLEKSKQSLSMTEKTYLEQMESLILSMRSHRHDLANHLQVIKGNLQIKEYDRAIQYLNTFVEEVNFTNISLAIKNQTLSISIHSKWMIAQAKGIHFKCEIDPIETFDKITPTDQIRLLTNLIDNAFEATLQLEEEQRKVSVKIHKILNLYTYEIENTGPEIREEDLEKIFIPGFSTKGTRGYGLAIVRDLVRKYHGEIQVTSKSGVTKFNVLIPTE